MKKISGVKHRVVIFRLPIDIAMTCYFCWKAPFLKLHERISPLQHHWFISDVLVEAELLKLGGVNNTEVAPEKALKYDVWDAKLLYKKCTFEEINFIKILVDINLSGWSTLVNDDFFKNPIMYFLWHYCQKFLGVEFRPTNSFLQKIHVHCNIYIKF